MGGPSAGGSGGGGGGGIGTVSPAFTGTPTAPTPLSSDNSNTLATTAFVQAVLGGAIPLSLTYSASTAAIGASGTFKCTGPGSVASSSLRCVGAPAGSNLIVQIQKNGVTQVTLTIVAGSTTEAIDNTNYSFATGDLISVNCTSAGSGTAATGVVVEIVYTA